MSNEEVKEEAQAEAPPPPPPEIPEEAYSELEAIVGTEYITKDPAICQGYAGRGYGREAFWYQGLAVKPGCVVMPKTAQEVSRIVKLCYRYDIPYTSGTTFQAVANSALLRPDFVMIDLSQMNKWYIDEKNMYAVLEPSVIYAQFNAELHKRDLYFISPGGGGQPSVVSNQMFQGQGIFNYRICPWPERRMNGVEWVTPEGDIVRIGTLLDGEEHVFWGHDPGPGLLGMFKGNTAWWGTMGILTKMATKVYPFQPEPMVPEGLNQDAALVFPPRIRWQNYTMPTEEALMNAMLEMSREELCGAMNRVPLFWREINRGGGRSEFWERWKTVTPEQCAQTHILRCLFIGYTSQEQLDYEMRVAEDIVVQKYGGTARRTKQTDNGAFLYSIVTGMWKPTGFYASENVGYASPRATWKLNDELVERLNKPPFNTAFFDQYREHPWFAPFFFSRVMYSEFMAHVDCEKIDPANPKFDPPGSLVPLLMFLHSEVPGSVIKHGTVNLFGNGHINSKLILGPANHNYHLWVQKLKAEFDPNDVCRKGLADHMDLVINQVPPCITEEFKETMKQVVELGWKEEE
jgi:hypothetical protein